MRTVLTFMFMLIPGALLLPAQTLAINDKGMVNAASYKAPGALPTVARGSIVSIFGKNFSNTTVAVDRLPVPTQLPGTTTKVLFDGLEAPLFYVSPTQINAQVPFEIPATAFSGGVVVRNGNLSSPEQRYFLTDADPGVFTLLQNGGGPGAILHADGSVVSLANPVRPGEDLVIFTTGMGAVDPPVMSGQPAPSAEPLPRVKNLPTVRLGGQSVQVTYAGLAPGFAGLYQVNVKVPANFTQKTPSVSITQAFGFSPTVSAGGPGLNSATPLTAATGSADLPISATGINISPTAALNFGGRRLTSTVQLGEPQTVSATVPASALRVAGAIPVNVTDAGVQSNNLNFLVTGTTIAGSPPVLSNVSIGAPTSGSLPTASVSFNFQDPDGDIVSNGTFDNSAKIEMKYTFCGGSRTNASSGTFLNFPDVTSRTVTYQIQFIGSFSRVSGPVNMDVTLIDQAGNRSNTVTATVSSWLC